MMLNVLTVAALVGVAAASWANNLNYRSPSHNHPGLGVSIHRVNKRHAGAPPQPANKLNFTHGVASGDPYPTSVILWTRCAPIVDDVNDNSTVTGVVPLFNPVPVHNQAVEKPPPASKAPVCLNYKVANDKALTNVVDSGTAYTSSDVDYTLKARAHPQEFRQHEANLSFLDRSKHRSSVLILNTSISSQFVARISKARLVVRKRRRILMICLRRLALRSIPAATFPSVSSTHTETLYGKSRSITCSTWETIFTNTLTVNTVGAKV